jgi:S-adenosylmethionine:tRNA ribosyltransferase-isomerase
MSNDPRNLSIQSYTYNLPNSRIAQHPVGKRDASKLLVYRDGKISDDKFSSIANYLNAGSLIVYNTTRVVRARLLMRRPSGARIEIFCTDAADASRDFVRTLGEKSKVNVIAFVGNSKKWNEAEILTAEFDGCVLSAKKISAHADQWNLELSWTPADLTFAEVLDNAGKIPLPPYMHREEETDDAERYQTIFATQEGSVAAPTAGLHFTTGVIQSILTKGIKSSAVTLHVGAGTFKPVKSETMAGHDMHREQVIVAREVIDELIAHHGKAREQGEGVNGITAIGTTALRTLESIYWFGRQLVLEPGQFRGSLFVGQWEPYEGGPEVPTMVALNAVKDWMQENKHNELTGFTQLLIAPGYKFHVVDALVTNFHQPQSTLLLLVAAFVGEDFRKIYDHALANDYRFLSYGDSSLLFRNT